MSLYIRNSANRAHRGSRLAAIASYRAQRPIDMKGRKNAPQAIDVSICKALPLSPH
jgi:hypothetical protein